MSVNLDELKKNTKVGGDELKEIRQLLDLMGYGYAVDETNKKLYYHGVMGSTPLFVVTGACMFGYYGEQDPTGKPYNPRWDYHIKLVFEKQAYHARYRLVTPKYNGPSKRVKTKLGDLILTGVFGPLEDTHALTSVVGVMDS